MTQWRQRTQQVMLSNGGIVFVLFLMIAAPAALTLHAVRVPATFIVNSADPTPRGYTWSLLLFLAPIGIVACWFLPMERLSLPRRPFWTTIAVLTPIGLALDFFFAKDFFYFGNPKATLGICAPALGKQVPIEEYVFYLSGFIAILSLYVWLDEYWLNLYRPPQYMQMAKEVPRLTQFHPASVVLGLALIGAAVLYRRLNSAEAPGFPGYWTFLVVTAVVPSAALFPEVKKFINWRALSFTVFFVLVISIFWEATLAMPYRWWGYKPEQMIGLSIGAWSGLPIEAACVWIAASYATVIVFEAIRIWNYSEQQASNLFLFGSRRRLQSEHLFASREDDKEIR